MSGLFDRLAARAVGGGRVLRPRVASRFEPLAPLDFTVDELALAPLESARPTDPGTTRDERPAVPAHDERAPRGAPVFQDAVREPPPPEPARHDEPVHAASGAAELVAREPVLAEPHAVEPIAAAPVGVLWRHAGSTAAPDSPSAREPRPAFAAEPPGPPGPPGPPQHASQPVPPPPPASYATPPPVPARPPQRAGAQAFVLPAIPGVLRADPRAGRGADPLEPDASVTAAPGEGWSTNVPGRRDVLAYGPGAGAEPAVRIHIGRIDVRAASPPAVQPSAPRAAHPAPRISLDEYLRSRRPGS
jgi:hypothetical protein